MIEALREINNKELPYSAGDVVLVLRDVGTDLETGQEEAGIVHDVEQGGRVFINYGGVVSLLHEKDQIRLAPADMREALKLRLNQNNEDLQKSMFEATRGLREALEKYHETDTFFKWIRHSIKSRFGKNKR